MTTNRLTFVNHACFYIENDETLLLVDPWVEGAVFNNGWSLLDTSTSNAALVHRLAKSKRATFIWFSHEHPDHFSISFVKRLKQDFPGKVTMLFQQTKDKRVVDFLRKNQFEVIECLPGAPVSLDASTSITVFPHADGDSYCLISSGGRHVLNINDCALSNADMCRAVKANLDRLTDRIDVLFTQFGYANWVGNPHDIALRRGAATEKLERIRLQMEILRPRITVPFASFVQFASIENRYMNEQQNTARAVATWARQTRATDSVRFLKPGDEIDLAADTAESMAWASDAAVEHWERLDTQPCELLPSEKPASIEQVRAAFDKHRGATRANLLVLPALLELLGLIKPLRIHLADLAVTVRVSYLTGWSMLAHDAPFDISMTSPSAAFLFNNEYGFNTTHVNGRFRTAHIDALVRFSRFFMPQNLRRQGYGVQHPLATASYLLANVSGRLIRLCTALPRRRRHP